MIRRRDGSRAETEERVKGVGYMHRPNDPLGRWGDHHTDAEPCDECGSAPSEAETLRISAHEKLERFMERAGEAWRRGYGPEQADRLVSHALEELVEAGTLAGVARAKETTDAGK